MTSAPPSQRARDVNRVNPWRGPLPPARPPSPTPQTPGGSAVPVPLQTARRQVEQPRGQDIEDEPDENRIAQRLRSIAWPEDVRKLPEEVDAEADPDQVIDE